jgi:HSP20 family protein
MTTTQSKTNGTDVVSWNPWPEIFPAAVRFSELFDRAWRGTALSDKFAPGGELEETDDAFTLELDLPGIDKDDITIEVTARRVSVTGSRREKERAGLLRHTTRVTGSFAYEVALPCDVEEKGVTAALNDGVLRVQLPKAGGAKATRIAIT